jgi:3-oxoacyl-[acyl-carrier-protein] synthase II
LSARAGDERRVVVTGIGMVSALGIGRDEPFEAALQGRSGAAPIRGFDASEHRVRIACEVSDFDPEDFMDRKAARRVDRFAQMAVAAAKLAVDDAGVPIGGGEGVGAVIASGTGGSITRDQQHDVFLERGPDRVSPFAIPQTVPNMSSAQVSIQLGLRGPVTTTATACAAGTDAIGIATSILRRGAAQTMLAGGSESLVTPFWVAGFDAMRVLTRNNDDPAGAARTFDAARDGFLIGEGSAVLVLESLEAARARGARPICEVLGHGASADAYHITDPSPSGEPQARAVTIALERAGVTPEEVGYVNAHGGASQPGDPAEVRALVTALGDAAADTPVSATKGLHGHCMAAAGAIEASLSALAVSRGRIPPTINLTVVDPECAGVDHVAGVARDAEVKVAVSTSFGLGGHNSALVLGRIDKDGARA